MALSSRERLIKTLNHEDPGKVVVELGSTGFSGINVVALKKLREYLKLEEKPIKMHEPFQMLGTVEDDLFEVLDLDCVPVTNDGTFFGYKNKDWKPWTTPSGVDVLVGGGFETTKDDRYTYIYAQGDTSYPPAAKSPTNGVFFDNITRHDPDFDEDTADGRRDFKEDFAVFTDEDLRLYEDYCNDLYNNTEYGLIGGGPLCGLGDFAMVPGPGRKQVKGIRDLAEYMMAHYTLPDYIKEIYDYQTEIALENCKLLYQAVGNKLQAMQVSGTDFGTQTGPYMSPDVYREFYKPYHSKVNGWIHENTSWKTVFHTCGSIVEFLKDFNEAGVDVLDPVQCNAAGMDPIMLKEKWGDKFTFLGAAVDTQGTLPFGTPEDVYNQTTERLNIFAPGGGFICATIHNILAQVEPENIMAYFKAIKDYNAKNGF